MEASAFKEIVEAGGVAIREDCRAYAKAYVEFCNEMVLASCHLTDLMMDVKVVEDLTRTALDMEEMGPPRRLTTHSEISCIVQDRAHKFSELVASVCFWRRDSVL